MARRRQGKANDPSSRVLARVKKRRQSRVVTGSDDRVTAGSDAVYVTNRIARALSLSTFRRQVDASTDNREQIGWLENRRGKRVEACKQGDIRFALERGRLLSPKWTALMGRLEGQRVADRAKCAKHCAWGKSG